MLYVCDQHWTTNKKVEKFTGCSIKGNLGFYRTPCVAENNFQKYRYHSVQVFPNTVSPVSTNNGVVQYAQSMRRWDALYMVQGLKIYVSTS